MIEQAILDKVNTWLEGNYDEATKEEIKSLLSENEEEIVNGFYKDLEFGTGGLRGVMGVGSNKMNKYTIGGATQGLANYLLKTYPNEQISVAVACDSRNNSPLFAQITADVFSANGIKVYLFEELRPTPELSFTIRHFGCKSGVVITASHNPKEYNGYKAYWNDGGQMVAPHDKNVITEVNEIASIDDIKFEGNKDLIQMIGADVDDAYLKEIEALSVSPDAIKAQNDLKIVFTSIHGTGITLVPEILKRMGFTNLTVVEEQAEPNGNFPTVVYPNPEEADALNMGLEKCKAIDADLLLGTDPDSDRVGIAVKDNKGEFILLNGNQTAVLLFNYLIKVRKEKGLYSEKDFLAKTIVTTDLIHTIAERNNYKCFDVLTGFKFIADLIKANEGKLNFVCGGEESYGYLIGDFVRDKDAISSVAMICEMAAYWKNEGKSLYSALLDIYAEYGLYKEKLTSITKKGRTGAEEIATMMKDLRATPPASIGGSKTVTLLDYEASIAKNLITGEETVIDLPKSNVLQFITEEGSKVSARPSGTEPKIKFYFSVKGNLASVADFDKEWANLDTKVEQIIEDMNLR